MANHGRSYGLSAELRKKRDEKRDSSQEQKALDWIEAVLDSPIDRSQPYEDILQDGVLLGKLINKIRPGSIRRVNENTKMPFKIMENIGSFLEAIKAYGVPSTDLFQTVDLYEKKDIGQVTQCIFALGRTCQGHQDYNGPTLGPKQSEENRRTFTEEQLSAGKNVIGLQAGYNKANENTLFNQDCRSVTLLNAIRERCCPTSDDEAARAPESIDLSDRDGNVKDLRKYPNMVAKEVLSDREDFILLRVGENEKGKLVYTPLLENEEIVTKAFLDKLAKGSKREALANKTKTAAAVRKSEPATSSSSSFSKKSATSMQQHKRK